jgi:hypothetical protein
MSDLSILELSLVVLVGVSAHKSERSVDSCTYAR